MLYLINSEFETQHLIRLVSNSLTSLYGPFGSISLSLENVLLSNVRWSARILSRTRLNQCRNLICELTSCKRQLFPFYFSTNSEGICQMVAPPTIEVYESPSGQLNYLILDGSHRCYAATATNFDVSAITISFVTKPRPLPCRPLSQSEILVQETQPHLKDLFVDFSESNFRPVRGLMHKSFRFLSLGKALETLNIPQSSLTAVNAIMHE